MDPEGELSLPEWVSCPKTGLAASSNAKIAAASRNQPQATRHARAVVGREGTVLPVTGRGKLIVRSAQGLIPNYLATSSSTPTNICGTLVQPVNTAIYSSWELPVEPCKMHAKGYMSHSRTHSHNAARPCQSILARSRVGSEVEAEFGRIRPRRHKMGSAERGQKVVQCGFIRQVDGSETQAPPVAVTVEKIVVAHCHIKQMPRFDARRVQVGIVGPGGR